MLDLLRHFFHRPGQVADHGAKGDAKLLARGARGGGDGFDQGGQGLPEVAFAAGQLDQAARIGPGGQLFLDELGQLRAEEVG